MTRCAASFTAMSSFAAIHPSLKKISGSYVSYTKEQFADRGRKERFQESIFLMFAPLM